MVWLSSGLALFTFVRLLKERKQWTRTSILYEYEYRCIRLVLVLEYSCARYENVGTALHNNTWNMRVVRGCFRQMLGEVHGPRRRRRIHFTT